MIVDWLVRLFLAEPVPTADSGKADRRYWVDAPTWSWYCVCGFVMHNYVERCRSCGSRR